MSRPERRCIVVAQSGRALAWAARAAGVGAHVLDLCADTDTAEFALSVERVGDWRSGLREPELLAALARLEAADPGLPLLCGGGFEDRPALLERIARGRPLLGCAPEVFRRLADRDALEALLDERLEGLGVTRPERCPGPVPAEGRWLQKRPDGCGGTHVRWLAPGESPAPGHYAQRWQPGASMSVLAVADGRSAQRLGLTRHWNAQPDPTQPFRHSGMLAAPCGGALAACLDALLGRLVPALGLRGLFGVDFILGPAGRVLVLDINARPPASLELHERAGSLFERHLLGVAGRLAEPPWAVFHSVRAQAVLYAPSALRTPALDWPAWASDRPPPGLAVAPGEPLCTVHAAGATAEAAGRRVRERMTEVLGRLYAPGPAPPVDLRLPEPALEAEPEAQT